MRIRRSLKRLGYKTLPYENWGSATKVKVSADHPHLGIMTNDFVIVEIGAIYQENQLALWKIDGNAYKTLAYAYHCFGDTGLTDNDGWAEHFNPNEITFVGMIKSIERPFVNSASVEVPEVPKEEITVVCDNCQMTLTASPDFIRAMGWRTRKNSSECIRCW